MMPYSLGSLFRKPSIWTSCLQSYQKLSDSFTTILWDFVIPPSIRNSLFPRKLTLPASRLLPASQIVDTQESEDTQEIPYSLYRNIQGVVNQSLWGRHEEWKALCQNIKDRVFTPPSTHEPNFLKNEGLLPQELRQAKSCLQHAQHESKAFKALFTNSSEESMNWLSQHIDLPVISTPTYIVDGQQVRDIFLRGSEDEKKAFFEVFKEIRQSLRSFKITPVFMFKNFDSHELPFTVDGGKNPHTFAFSGIPGLVNKRVEFLKSELKNTLDKEVYHLQRRLYKTLRETGNEFIDTFVAKPMGGALRPLARQVSKVVNKSCQPLELERKTTSQEVSILSSDCYFQDLMDELWQDPHIHSLFFFPSEVEVSQPSKLFDLAFSKEVIYSYIKEAAPFYGLETVVIDDLFTLCLYHYGKDFSLDEAKSCLQYIQKRLLENIPTERRGLLLSLLNGEEELNEENERALTRWYTQALPIDLEKWVEEAAGSTRTSPSHIEHVFDHDFMTTSSSSFKFIHDLNKNDFIDFAKDRGFTQEQAQVVFELHVKEFGEKFPLFLAKKFLTFISLEVNGVKEFEKANAEERASIQGKYKDLFANKNMLDHLMLIHVKKCNIYPLHYEKYRQWIVEKLENSDTVAIEDNSCMRLKNLCKDLSYIFEDESRVVYRCGLNIQLLNKLEFSKEEQLKEMGLMLSHQFQNIEAGKELYIFLPPAVGLEKESRELFIELAKAFPAVKAKLISFQVSSDKSEGRARGPYNFFTACLEGIAKRAFGEYQDMPSSAFRYESKYFDTAMHLDSLEKAEIQELIDQEPVFVFNGVLVDFYTFLGKEFTYNLEKIQALHRKILNQKINSKKELCDFLIKEFEDVLTEQDIRYQLKIFSFYEKVREGVKKFTKAMSTSSTISKVLLIGFRVLGLAGMLYGTYRFSKKR